MVMIGRKKAGSKAWQLAGSLADGRSLLLRLGREVRPSNWMNDWTGAWINNEILGLSTMAQGDQWTKVYLRQSSCCARFWF